VEKVLNDQQSLAAQGKQNFANLIDPFLGRQFLDTAKIIKRKR
jgi:hypothetical protein